MAVVVSRTHNWRWRYEAHRCGGLLHKIICTQTLVMHWPTNRLVWLSDNTGGCCCNTTWCSCLTTSTRIFLARKTRFYTYKQTHSLTPKDFGSYLLPTTKGGVEKTEWEENTHTPCMYFFSQQLECFTLFTTSSSSFLSKHCYYMAVKKKWELKKWQLSSRGVKGTVYGCQQTDERNW